TPDNPAAALRDIERTFGSGSVMRLGEQPAEQVIGVISTGSTALDEALGVGGLPRGRVSEVYGAEGAGKTTVALHVIAQAQAGGLVCAFIDTECSLDLGYAGAIGVDIDLLFFSLPQIAADALESANRLIGSGGYGS